MDTSPNTDWTLAAVAFGIIAFCAAEMQRGDSPADVVASFLRALNGQSVERMMDHLAADFVFRDTDSKYRITRNDIRPILEWDVVMKGTLRHTILSVDGDTVEATISEHNEFYRLLGMGEQNHRVRFRVKGKLIHEEVIEATHSEGPAFPEALKPVVEWALKNRPEVLEKAYPNGQVRFNAEGARLWLSILKEWSRASQPRKK